MLLPLQIVVVVVVVGTYSKCVPKRLKGPTIPTNSNKANNNDDNPHPHSTKIYSPVSAWVRGWEWEFRNGIMKNPKFMVGRWIPRSFRIFH